MLLQAVTAKAAGFVETIKSVAVTFKKTSLAGKSGSDRPIAAAINTHFALLSALGTCIPHGSVIGCTMLIQQPFFSSSMMTNLYSSLVFELSIN